MKLTQEQSQPAQDYGEPWRVGTIGRPVLNREGVEMFFLLSEAQRAIACTNACAGIQDPAAAIQAARDALQLVSEFLETAHIVEADWGRYQPKQITQALKLLTPKKP